MSHSLSRVPFTEPSAPADDLLSELISDAAHRLGGIGRRAAVIAGSADDLDNLSRQAEQVFADMKKSLGGMIAANRQIADYAGRGVGKAEQTHVTVREALDRASGLADSVKRVEGAISDVSRTLRQVADASESINKIAFQTRIVAFNASVEAVRAGEAGRGFGVVAEAVKDLAQSVANSSREIALEIEQLGNRVKDLEAQIRQGRDGGDALDAQSVVRQAIDSFESNFGEVEGLMQETARFSAGNLALCDQSVATLNTFGQEFAQSVALIGAIRQETGHLLETSEDAIARFADSGVETEDSPFIAAAIETAARIGEVFEAAVAEGRLSLADLFDQRYRPIPRTNPQQHMAAFVPFTDAVLPEIQEPILELSPLVAFCAAVDRNGFLPTHNLKFSQPQGSNPVKNAAFSRNRRIFNDRTGLRAARNEAAFLLQTYRRDLGAGEFRLMKDVSAPIWVQGRHWGGLRIGYGFSD